LWALLLLGGTVQSQLVGDTFPPEFARIRGNVGYPIRRATSLFLFLENVSPRQIHAVSLRGGLSNGNLGIHTEVWISKTSLSYAAIRDVVSVSHDPTSLQLCYLEKKSSHRSYSVPVEWGAFSTFRPEEELYTFIFEYPFVIRETTNLIVEFRVGEITAEPGRDEWIVDAFYEIRGLGPGGPTYSITYLPVTSDWRGCRQGTWSHQSSFVLYYDYRDSSYCLSLKAFWGDPSQTVFYFIGKYSPNLPPIYLGASGVKCPWFVDPFDVGIPLGVWNGPTRQVIDLRVPAFPSLWGGQIALQSFLWGESQGEILAVSSLWLGGLTPAYSALRHHPSAIRIPNPNSYYQDVGVPVILH